MSRLFLIGKDTNSLRRIQGKRALATLDACKLDLKKDLPRMFGVFNTALNRANKSINSYPPESRARGFEATIMQTSFMDELQKEFGNNTFFGKHKRIVFRKNGYIILFKKLDKKGYPMNIKTQNVQSILSQNQVLDLFAKSDYNEEPILYFGYQRDKFGNFVNPQLIYIDDGEIKFTINQNDVGVIKPILKAEKSAKEVNTPKLKSGLKKKQA